MCWQIETELYISKDGLGGKSGGSEFFRVVVEPRASVPAAAVSQRNRDSMAAAFQSWAGLGLLHISNFRPVPGSVTSKGCR
jgi:hypothetical protein